MIVDGIEYERYKEFLNKLRNDLIEVRDWQSDIIHDSVTPSHIIGIFEGRKEFTEQVLSLLELVIERNI